MSYQYTLTVSNHATDSDYIMVFQNDPGSFDPNAMALAWFSKFSNPGTTLQFQWVIDWGFSWSDTGPLRGGVIYHSFQDLPITGGTDNKVTLDYNGAYEFTHQIPGDDANRFYIKEDGSIPVGSSASVAITMAGSPVYATQAKPNHNITASPHPTYYVAYGDYKPGQVIDVSEINNPLELPYATGIYSLTTTLNADFTWTKPQTLPEANA